MNDKLLTDHLITSQGPSQIRSRFVLRVRGWGPLTILVLWVIFALRGIYAFLTGY